MMMSEFETTAFDWQTVPLDRLLAQLIPWALAQGFEIQTRKCRFCDGSGYEEDDGERLPCMACHTSGEVAT